MALSINPNFVPALGNSAIAGAAIRAGQIASPAIVQAAQRIFNALSLADSLFGQQFVDTPNASLGYLTPNQAKAAATRMREVGPARKNLFFVRVTDSNPPKLPYGNSTTAAGLFDLLVLDITYSGSTLTGDKQAIGSAVMDRLTGTEATDVQMTTMDDEAGTLKRWFDAKVAQAAHDDGTFGVPAEYAVQIEVVHGVASPQMDQKYIAAAYKRAFWVRPASCSHELSKREQGPSEIQMTFTQLDTWLDAKPAK